MLRRTSKIATILQQGGPFTGDNRPTTRVAVIANWYLNMSTGPVGNFTGDKLPVRWWNDAVDGPGAMVEIPNLKSCSIDRQLSQAADTIELDFYNTATPANGTAGPVSDTFGERGYLAPFYGSTAQAQQRWNQAPNSWANVLRENAMLFVYQGYGGWQHADGSIKTLDQAIADGSVMLTGVFLVDTVAIEAQSGMGKLTGRSMAKLLIEQSAWPPLVPSSFYTAAGIVYYHDQGLVDLPVTVYGTDGAVPYPTSAPYAGGTNWISTGVTAPLEGTFKKAVYDMAIMPDNQGYRLVGSDGGVFCYGSAAFAGSEGSVKLNAKAVAIENTTSGNGYWVACADGGVFAFGDAVYLGGKAGQSLSAPIMCMRRTPSGSGYWLCGQDGGIFTFGDAPFYGSGVGRVNGTVVGFAPRPQGDGYWLLTSVGSIYSFGNASYHGGLDTLSPNPLSDGGIPMAVEASGTGNGYRIVTSTGGIFDFGDAKYYTLDGGTLGAANAQITGLPQMRLNAPASNIRRTPDDNGYYVVAEDGGVFTFGDSNFHGSMPGEWDFTVAGNYCADEETEIFTRRGWLRWNEVNPGDFTLAIDPEDGHAHWERIESVFRNSVENEPMVSMEARGHSSLTTPNHRWLAKRQDGQWIWTTSDEMLPSYGIPTTAPYADAPLEAIYDDAFVEVVAWFWTEGNIDHSGSPNGRLSLSQSPSANPANCTRIERALEKAFGPISSETGSIAEGDPWCRYTVNTGTFSYRLSAAVRDGVLTVCPNKVPTVEFLLALTSSQLELFVQTSIDADGHRRTTPSAWTGLSQQDEKRIRAFEFACHLAGYGTSTTESVDQRGKTTWTTTVRTTSTIKASGSKKWGRQAVEHTGHVWCPTLRSHNWLARRHGTTYFTGNTDYADIISDFLLWSGWYLHGSPNNPGQRPPVFGVIQYTGAYNVVGPIPPPDLDKFQIIDIIKKLKDVVGYIFRVREDGSAYFNSPNIWQMGNHYDDMTPAPDLPIIDERLNMTDYVQTTSDTTLRSEIIVAAEDPYIFGGKPVGALSPLIVTRFVPPNIQSLHGIVKPAMIGVPLNVPISQQDQDLLAELQALFCWLGLRTGQVSAVVDPAICPDDQIRILERSSGETSVHYVVGVHTSHDLQQGTWIATYTTQWMGDRDSWSIQTSLNGGVLSDQAFDINGNLIFNQTYIISDTLAVALGNTGATTTQAFRIANGFGDVTGSPTI